MTRALEGLASFATLELPGPTRPYSRHSFLGGGQTGGHFVPRGLPPVSGAGFDSGGGLPVDHRLLLRLPGVIEPETDDLPIGVVRHVLHAFPDLRDGPAHLAGGGVGPEGDLSLAAVLQAVVKVQGAGAFHRAGRLGEVLCEVVS